MSVKKLTSETKEKIAHITSELVDSVEMGEDPKAAAIKLAKAYDLTKDQIRMVVRAYNTAASLAQLEEFDKRAEVPRVINAEEVVKAVFGGKRTKVASQEVQEKPQVVSSDWSLPVQAVVRTDTPIRTSRIIKFATVDRPKPEPKDNTPFLAQQARKEAAVVKLAAERRFVDAIQQLAEYFSVTGAIDPKIAEQNAVAAFGKDSKTIIKSALDFAGLKKKPIYSNNPVFDPQKPPYNLIKQAVDACNDYLQAVKTEKLADEVAPKKKKLDLANLRKPIYGTIFPELEPERWQTIFPELEFGKEAAAKTGINISPFGPTAQTLALGLGEVFGHPRESVVKPTDVTMNIEATTLRTKSYLIHLMANDPVISKYPPEEVVKVYNALSRLAPRAMQQPNVIVMYLRIALQSGGSLDNFHTNSLVAINRELDRVATGISSGAFSLAERGTGESEEAA